jgi:hypothetical protein
MTAKKPEQCEEDWLAAEAALKATQEMHGGPERFAVREWRSRQQHHRVPRPTFVTIAKRSWVALALTVLAFIIYIAMPPAVIKQATALLGPGLKTKRKMRMILSDGARQGLQ